MPVGIGEGYSRQQAGWRLTRFCPISPIDRLARLPKRDREPTHRICCRIRANPVSVGFMVDCGRYRKFGRCEGQLSYGNSGPEGGCGIGLTALLKLYQITDIAGLMPKQEGQSGG